jgi:hypothetical protein
MTNHYTHSVSTQNWPAKHMLPETEHQTNTKVQVRLFRQCFKLMYIQASSGVLSVAFTTQNGSVKDIVPMP